MLTFSDYGIDSEWFYMIFSNDFFSQNVDDTILSLSRYKAYFLFYYKGCAVVSQRKTSIKMMS